MKHEFTLGSFALRALFAVLLVLISFNPSGISYYHWATSPDSGPMAVKLLAALILLVGWVIYGRATKNSLGLAGTILVGLLFAVLLWVLIEFGLLRADTGTAVAWLAELVLAAVLAIGISWSHIQRRISGQYDTDEIEG